MIIPLYELLKVSVTYILQQLLMRKAVLKKSRLDVLHIDKGGGDHMPHPDGRPDRTSERAVSEQVRQVPPGELR